MFEVVPKEFTRPYASSNTSASSHPGSSLSWWGRLKKKLHVSLLEGVRSPSADAWEIWSNTMESGNAYAGLRRTNLATRPVSRHKQPCSAVITACQWGNLPLPP